MSAKSFFQSTAPRLIRRLDIRGSIAGSIADGINNNITMAIEIWKTTCIVTNFGQGTAANSQILVNPANPQLSGVSKFPYFPRGGPVPSQSLNGRKGWTPLGFVSQWGGMEVGNGMLFPVSVIDGLVHLYGGMPLQLACQWHQIKAAAGGADACPIGSAVVTTAGALSSSYQSIIHTAPPFYQRQHNSNTTKKVESSRNEEDDMEYAASSMDDNPMELLGSCYRSALEQAASLLSSSDENTHSASRSSQPSLRVAFPLLGSGARGFPHDIAMQVAAKACLGWCHHRHQQSHHRVHGTIHLTLVFGLLEEVHAKQFAEIVERTVIQSDSLALEQRKYDTAQ